MSNQNSNQNASQQPQPATSAVTFHFLHYVHNVGFVDESQLARYSPQYAALIFLTPPSSPGPQPAPATEVTFVYESPSTGDNDVMEIMIRPAESKMEPETGSETARKKSEEKEETVPEMQEPSQVATPRSE
ncbi:hypothetical protein ISF_01814 [Cordyceps fumosorosea ARSEF 2679]|uniref:Uncharacterized protein n=1 Tax=Cordyceps fumosorosea (strain ARSEF 2679) TaxID=1081104 RepID=A0A168CDS5_CORFA|nr:hypothetical protein ISF_01814 [Cordyceps fumosorosea ARSEF 2679]OAA71263.1 hypothetical protein ISF_01814 [Cordyceps fumosorosea ARSEF 2679]